MFATGVSFMYGLAIASVLAVLLTLAASLTVLPAMLSRFGPRLVRPQPHEAGLLGVAKRPLPAATAPVRQSPPRARSAWRRWSRVVQARPWPLAIVSLAVMVALLTPVFALRLDTSDAGNDPANTSSRHAFDLLAKGFGPGFNGPLLLVAELPAPRHTACAVELRAARQRDPRRRRRHPAAARAVGARSRSCRPTPTRPRRRRRRPTSSTTCATTCCRRFEHRTGVPVLVGGFTAGSIDFSSVLASKLPLFIGIVVVLSALLLFVIFRSLVIPVQAAVMNLLSIGGALGVTVAVFQWGWFAGVLGVQKGPIEPWIPVLMFAVVFGLSMDYEVFLDLARARGVGPPARRLRRRRPTGSRSPAG